MGLFDNLNLFKRSNTNASQVEERSLAEALKGTESEMVSCTAR